MDKEKWFFNWSSGKDAAMALFELQQHKQPIHLLLTTINTKYQRVSMHGLRLSLLQAQAEAIGLPLQLMELEENPSMASYNALMKQNLLALKARGFTTSCFGDIFLEDLRAYREQQLEKLDIKAVFPIWEKDTRELLNRFIDLGFKAIVVCIDERVLDKSFCGREIDRSFLTDLPANVDPCGENGEFHTFCYDGPIFKYPVTFVKGKRTRRTYPAPSSDHNTSEYGFWFCDLELLP